MRYEKIKEVESLINLAFAICGLPALMFRLYWLLIVTVILIISDCVAMVYMIYAYGKENKSVSATLKKHWFYILWLVFVAFCSIILYINTSQV